MTASEMYRLALANELPRHRAARVLQPSGCTCDDWNAAVLGAVHLAAWAKNQIPIRQDIVDRERTDVEFLISALVGAKWRVVEYNAATERGAVRPVSSKGDASRDRDKGTRGVGGETDREAADRIRADEGLPRGGKPKGRGSRKSAEGYGDCLEGFEFAPDALEGVSLDTRS